MKDKSEWDIYKNQMKIKIKNRYNNKKIYIAESAAKRVKKEDTQTFITEEQQVIMDEVFYMNLHNYPLIDKQRDQQSKWSNL